VCLLSGCGSPQTERLQPELEVLELPATPTCQEAHPNDEGLVTAFFADRSYVERLAMQVVEGPPEATQGIPDGEVAICVYSTDGSPLEAAGPFLALWAAPNYGGSYLIGAW
jgi:hypothetical protein